MFQQHVIHGVPINHTHTHYTLLCIPSDIHDVSHKIQVTLPIVMPASDGCTIDTATTKNLKLEDLNYTREIYPMTVYV
jgi:hypothetical protein